MHQPLDGVGQRHEHAEVGDAGDHPGEALAQVLLGPAGVVVAGQVPLGGLGAALALARLLGQLGEVGLQPRLERRRQPVLQQRAHDAVHHQVGVAPDGAGEVQVVLEGQAEVPQVLGAVARLLEAAQQQGVDDLRLGLAGRLAQDALQVLRPGVLQVEGVAEAAERLLERLHLLLAGILVHAVERGHVLPVELLGHQPVGQQHHLLDELPGRVAAHRRQMQSTLLVDVHLGLGEVEIERAGADALDAQLLAEVDEHLDVALELALAVRQAAAVAEALDLLVGEPPVGLDDGLAEAHALDVAAAADVHEHRQRQPRLALDQRADAVGEPFRQHRQGAAGQVDAGSALARLRIEAGALGDVVGDVGDVHPDAQQAVLAAALEALQGEGVVEVLGVLPVDGEGADVAVVGAALHHVAAHGRRNRLGLGGGVGVEVGLETVLDDDRLGLDLGVVAAA